MKKKVRLVTNDDDDDYTKSALSYSNVLDHVYFPAYTLKDDAKINVSDYVKPQRKSLLNSCVMCGSYEENVHYLCFPLQLQFQRTTLFSLRVHTVSLFYHLAVGQHDF